MVNQIYFLLLNDQFQSIIAGVNVSAFTLGAVAVTQQFSMLLLGELVKCLMKVANTALR